jgi:hypothetical protein
MSIPPSVPSGPPERFENKADDWLTEYALHLLVKEGYVRKYRGRNGEFCYESIKPYREKDDPRKGQCEPGTG